MVQTIYQTILNYLIWLCEKCDWFKHSDIIQKIIDNAKQNMSEEPKPAAKPEPKKKEKKQTVKISSDETEKTIEF